MNAEILCVGTELLLGEIVNTNAKYLSVELAKLGINVFYQTVVGDNADRLFSAIKIAFDRADIVITTGGLGPTDDDITKDIGAKFFKKELELNKEALLNIQKYFDNKNMDMPKTNIKQAYIPKDSIVLKNNNGTAPGCFIEDKNKILIMLPGPPNEVKPMFEAEVLPIIKKKQENVFVSKSLNLCGIGESLAAEKISNIIKNSKNPTVAPYAQKNQVRIRLTASAKNEQEATDLIKETSNKIYDELGEFIYSEDNISLPQVILDKLIKNNLTIAVAESCSGGLLASSFVDLPNASKAFLGGVVTYCDKSKMNLLNVSEKNLQKYGAVSHEVAYDMAKNVCDVFGSDIGLSVTGIAGPTGGTKQKPVGLIFIAICIKNQVFVKQLNLIGNREKIRNKTVVEILNFLRLKLKD